MVDSVSEIPLPVMDRAEDVQARLDPQFPSFVRVMLPSHVVRGFWLVNSDNRLLLVGYILVIVIVVIIY